jgi:glycosyltransferase involved in cell wall biosynthesis
MKIAVCYNLPLGGAKRAMHELVKRLAQRHAVDFYSVNAETADGWEVGPLVHRTFATPGPRPAPGFGMLRGLAGIRRTYRKIADLIDAGGYEVALVSQCQLAHSPFLLRYLRVPSVYYCQESSNRHLEPQVAFAGRLAWLKRAVVWWRYWSVDRANARRATVICANSRYSVECLYRAYGVHPRYCPLGVAGDFFRPLNLPREPEILVVGSLTRTKAPEFVLESAATLAQPPLVRFVFNFSSSVPLAALQKRAGELGVPMAASNLASDEDLLQAYNRAALVAVPSILEPMGFVPLEAMACETPVVGVAEGGIREAVQDGVTGLLTGRDPIEFGRAIQAVRDDPALGRRLGAAGRDYVLRERGWDQVCARLEEILRRAVELQRAQ